MNRLLSIGVAGLLILLACSMVKTTAQTTGLVYAMATLTAVLHVLAPRLRTCVDPFLWVVALGLGTGLVLLAYDVAIPDTLSPRLKAGAYALMGIGLPLLVARVL